MARLPTTRLAPSPTGALHLGNLRTFLVNWAMARQNGWRIVLRIEDLDGPRVKPGAIDQCMDLLSWVGIDWDEGPLVQSNDLDPYILAMRHLASHGLAYPCELTRSEIEASASAPQEGSGETHFPAELRPELIPKPFVDTGTNWRLAVPDAPVQFIDAFAGEHTLNPARSVGDFVVWTKRGQPSYQLAVVIDDARQDITHVVRGDDLLDSAARQIVLYHILGLEPPEHWIHLPLVIGSDGKRLAKRHGETKALTYRHRGVRPERIIGLMGRWCGIGDGVFEMSAVEFRDQFDLARMPREPVVFTEEDDSWLGDGTDRC